MSNLFKGLDHMQLTAPLGKDKEVRHFFIDILGCEEVSKPESLMHFESLWFDIGKHIIHIGMEEDFHAEKRGHPAFEVRSLDKLMHRFDAYEIPYEEDYNMPGAHRLYSYAFFDHRMEFLEWQDKPEALKGSLER